MKKYLTKSLQDKVTDAENTSQISHNAIEIPKENSLKCDNVLEEELLFSAPTEKLTKRETEILKLIIAGHTNKEIAVKLHRTERTIEYHRYRLMRKIGVRRTADLIKQSIIMGFV